MTTSEALTLLRLNTPLIDVRAPQEYNQGAIPNSVNLPILNDDERKEVGTIYKHSGAAAANTAGHALVCGESRSARISAWLQHIRLHPNARIMCWRGGQRSRITQQWLREQGVTADRVSGGYKCLRRACIDTLDRAANDDNQWWVVAGRTGVQKTVLIRSIPTSIDLEGLAHHRGSAFGGYTQPQPALATFENALAVAYLQHQSNLVVLEDESRTIGRLGLPAQWHARMQTAPLVVLEASLETRVEHIVKEYVTDALTQETPAALQARLSEALQRISRRLGGVLFGEIHQLLQDAFAGRSSHQAWVQALLSRYYDPMYDYQLQRKLARVRFRGSMPEVHAFLTKLQERA
jgi:tRNA 2-selenouridine synthase